jgi:hypothetical protein
VGKIAQLDLVLGEDIGKSAEPQLFQPLTEVTDVDVPGMSG